MYRASSMSTKTRKDPLTATAKELGGLLDSKHVDGVELVRIYLDQIAQHNHTGLCLNAIISTADKTDVIKLARDLDAERRQKGRRSPLHGIPIIIKVDNATIRETCLGS